MLTPMDWARAAFRALLAELADEAKGVDAVLEHDQVGQVCLGKGSAGPGTQVMPSVVVHT
jgi:hypothetical protein